MFQEQLPSAQRVSRTLADILREPEFQAFEGGLSSRVLTEAWVRFREWVSGMFPDISESQAELLTVLISAICLGAVALVLVRSLPRPDPQSARRDPEGAPGEGRTARDWLRIARERARAAEYRHAATALYQGFVLTLERRGAVDFHPSKTPGEYALEAAGGGIIDDREKADAANFMRSFQELAFGHDDPTSSGYRGLQQLAGQVGCPVARDERAVTREGAQ